MLKWCRIVEVSIVSVLGSVGFSTKAEESLHEALAGSWFEFKDDEGQPIRAKLSWARPVGSKYLFVDQNGETIADKTLKELAAEVKAGKAIILESIPLFERALGAIADRLQGEDPGSS